MEKSAALIGMLFLSPITFILTLIWAGDGEIFCRDVILLPENVLLAHQERALYFAGRAFAIGVRNS